MSDKSNQSPDCPPLPIRQRWRQILWQPSNETERLWRNLAIAFLLAIVILGVAFCLRDTSEPTPDDVQAASQTDGAIPSSESEAASMAWQMSEQQAQGMTAPAEELPSNASIPNLSSSQP